VYGWSRRARALVGLGDAAAAADAERQANEHRARFNVV
jgi:hypothetical protein